MKAIRMKDMLVMSVLILSAFVALSSCSKDDGDVSSVVVNDGGKVSGNHIFSAIDDKNFYIDYIKYSVVSGHLEVSGFDRTSFSGEADIISQLTYKGITYRVTEIAGWAFAGCTALTSVRIPDTVTEIGDLAFRNCTALTSLYIPASVTGFSASSISGCKGLAAIEVDGNSSKYCSVDGVLYSKDKTQLCRYPCGKSGAYTIPSTVTSVGPCVFEGCSSLKTLTIPGSVTSMENNSLQNCGIEELIYADGCKKVFRTGITSAVKVVIPNSVTEIEDLAFYDCFPLISVNIPDGVTKIGKSTFYGCTRLTSIIIPSSVTVIEEGAFQCCRSLASITFPASVTKIGYFAFDDCYMSDVTCLGQTPPAVQSEAFEDDLERLHVPHGCKDVYSNSNLGYSFKEILEDI